MQREKSGFRICGRWVAYDVTKRKQEGTEHRTLGNTLRDWGCVRVGFIDADELVAVREV